MDDWGAVPIGDLINTPHNSQNKLKAKLEDIIANRTWCFHQVILSHLPMLHNLV